MPVPRERLRPVKHAAKQVSPPLILVLLVKNKESGLYVSLVFEPDGCSYVQLDNRMICRCRGTG